MLSTPPRKLQERNLVRPSEILLRDSATVDCDPHIGVGYHVNSRWITGGKP